MAAVVERQSGALSPLPPALAAHIFLLLPADARARCACVFRGWRTAVDDAALWTRLDLSRFSGLAVHVTDAVLAGAARKARGTLQALDVTGSTSVSPDAFLACVTLNGGTLRQVRCVNAQPWFGDGALGFADVLALLHAAPALRSLDVDVTATSQADVHSMLRNEGVFAPLRVRRLCVGAGHEEEPEGAPLTEAAVLSLAADVAAHASLTHLIVCNAQLSPPAAVDALVDAALERRLRGFALHDCEHAAAAPDLPLGVARLLRGGALVELSLIDTGRRTLCHAASLQELCAALRQSTTLTTLHLGWMALCANPGAATALLRALTAHASLQQLTVLEDVDGGAPPDVAAAFGALVAANAPALRELCLGGYDFGAAGLRPLLSALPGNTHLRSLTLPETILSETFARDVLLPAVRANASLLQLQAPDSGTSRSLREALAIVERRGRRAAHAE